MCGLNKRQKMSDAGSHTLLSASISALININNAVSKLNGQTGSHSLELLPGLKRDFGTWWLQALKGGRSPAAACRGSGPCAFCKKEWCVSALVCGSAVRYFSTPVTMDQMLQCKPLIDQQLHQKQKQVLEVLDTVAMCWYLEVSPRLFYIWVLKKLQTVKKAESWWHILLLVTCLLLWWNCLTIES